MNNRVKCSTKIYTSNIYRFLTVQCNGPIIDTFQQLTVNMLNDETKNHVGVYLSNYASLNDQVIDPYKCAP